MRLIWLCVAPSSLALFPILAGGAAAAGGVKVGLPVAGDAAPAAACADRAAASAAAFRPACESAACAPIASCWQSMAPLLLWAV